MAAGGPQLRQCDKDLHRSREERRAALLALCNRRVDVLNEKIELAMPTGDTDRIAKRLTERMEKIGEKPRSYDDLIAGADVDEWGAFLERKGSVRGQWPSPGNREAIIAFAMKFRSGRCSAGLDPNEDDGWCSRRFSLLRSCTRPRLSKKRSLCLRAQLSLCAAFGSQYILQKI